MSASSLLTGLDRIGLVARAALAGLRHRGELAALEAGEARDHLLRSLVLALATFASVQLASLGLMFAAAAAVWHREDREWWLGSLALLQIALAIGLGRALVRRLRTWDPLEETLRQLRADGECLDSILSRDNDPNEERPD